MALEFRNKPYIRNFVKPIWDGKKKLNGKTILIWSEQGVGDTINWLSRLSLISSEAKHCILECQEKLVPLLKRSFPNIEIKPEDRSIDKERDDFDFHLPMGSLYKSVLDKINEQGKVNSYLIADPTRVKFWKDRLLSLGKGPFVGISWKSSNMSSYRLQNYTSMSDWLPVFKIPNVTFINLQYSEYEEDIVRVQENFGVTIHDFEDLDQYQNIDDLAALITALDIVISIRNSVPLISAGLGVDTKLVSWKQSYWNNILSNSHSKSIKMIHKNTHETWERVFNSIADDIYKHKIDLSNK